MLRPSDHAIGPSLSIPATSNDVPNRILLGSDVAVTLVQSFRKLIYLAMSTFHQSLSCLLPSHHDDYLLQYLG